MSAAARSGADDAAVSDFVIGRTTTLLGTEVEVLGWARWRTADGYVWHEVTLRTADAERWTLELDQGHVLLFRSAPDLDFGEPDGFPGQKHALDRKRWVWTPTRSRLERVEGEYWKDLTPGDREESQSYYAAPTALTASREIGTPDPWEWTQGVYLDRRDVERAFGVELPRIAEPHPARPWPYRSWKRVVATALPILAVISLLAAAVLGSGETQQVLSETVPIQSASGLTAVGVLDADGPTLTGVRLRVVGIDQAWLWAQAGIGPLPAEDADPDTLQPQLLATFPTELSYYSGRDSDGSWEEANRDHTHGLRVEGGSYLVWLEWELDPVAVGRLDMKPVKLHIDVLTGYRPATELLVWGIFLLILTAIYWFAKLHAWHRVMVAHDLRSDD